MVQTQAHTVITISAVFAVLTAIIMGSRFYARVVIVKRIGWDDYLISIAALLAWAFIAATILAVNHGLGGHYEDVIQRGDENMMSYLQIVWLSSIFYNACLGFIKTSVLALYTRLGDRQLKRLAQIMLVVVACQAGGNVISCIFECNPIAGAYDASIKAKCFDVNAFYLANAAVNIFTDLLTYTLPIKLVINLQVPKNQKIGLGVMLCLGLFACVSSIIRIAYIPQMLVSQDQTWAITGAMYWSVIETNVGIMAASIPSFKVIAKRYAPRLLGSYYESGTNVKSGGMSRSRFRKMTSRGHGEDSNGDVVNLRSINGRGDEEHGKTGVKTMIEQDRASNSSEEALTLPDGAIGVRTQITTQVEGIESINSRGGESENSSYANSFEDAKPMPQVHVSERHH
ncbi:hypothetical protein K490DRAFT_65499 [Saccharata proteae CBS 121410]|uniref:Rhodopsin domain-containing protein n=1 Tax=Saccharata proteae CBS 121410 TaxID=1314787 RepID=A0A9P4M086_9PEZI|nr:hypothetical protein K490DRAFT_65499 [Saccharata proteae CBS 121410]